MPFCGLSLVASSRNVLCWCPGSTPEEMLAGVSSGLFSNTDSISSTARSVAFLVPTCLRVMGWFEIQRCMVDLEGCPVLSCACCKLLAEGRRIPCLLFEIRRTVSHFFLFRV